MELNVSEHPLLIFTASHLSKVSGIGEKNEWGANKKGGVSSATGHCIVTGGQAVEPYI